MKTLLCLSPEAAAHNHSRSGAPILVPMVMGTSGTVAVHLRDCGELGLPSSLHVETWYPGKEGRAPLTRGVSAHCEDLLREEVETVRRVA